MKLKAKLVILGCVCLLAAPAGAMKDARFETRERAVLVITSADGERHTIQVQSFTHGIEAEPSTSGVPTGKRQHMALLLTKPVDKSTPLIMAALVNNEVILEWRMTVAPVGRAGRVGAARTIRLMRPSVCGITSDLGADGIAREHVSFCYQRIIWTWQDGGITAEDDWETPRA